MKTCTRCRQERDEASFYRNPRSKDGLEYRCKQCHREMSRIRSAKYFQMHKNRIVARRRAERQADPAKWKALDKQYSRTHNLKKYGLTREAFNEKLRQQDGMCTLCERPLTETNTAVDHCHTSGKVRDLLCKSCNSYLGWVERPGWLERTIAYIERHRSKA